MAFQDEHTVDVVLRWARLVQDEQGKPCTSSPELYQQLIIKSRDWVKIEALNVTTTSDGRESQTSNGGLATDADIARPKGAGCVST